MGERLTSAATRYVNLCAVERDLRKQRKACRCAHIMPAMPRVPIDQIPRRHPDGEPWASNECWKMVNNYDNEQTHRERYGEGSDRGWCDACTERQRLHEELAGVTRKRVGAWATLRAAVASEVCDE